MRCQSKNAPKWAEGSEPIRCGKCFWRLVDLDLITLDVCSFSRCPKNVSVAVSNWPFLGPRDHRSDQSTHAALEPSGLLGSPR